MIQRISQSNTPEHLPAEWPEQKRGHNITLFHKRPPLRKMVVMVDYSATFGDATNNPKISLLTKLLTHPYIDLYRYSKGKPSENAEQISHPLSDLSGYVGWAITYDEEDGRIPLISSLGKNSFSSGGVTGNLHVVASNDSSDTTYSDLDAKDSSKRRLDDVVAVQAARALNADIFITDRPYLYNSRLPIAKNILVIRPEDALPVIGLYLRAQGEYFIDETDGITLTTSRWEFFWIGSHELLFQSWRLYAACSQYADGSSDSRPSMLEGTLQHRLCRVLQARDSIHVAINDINSDESLIGEFDGVLVNLVGVLDASARIADQALGLNTDARAIGWQNDRWLSQFDPGYIELSDLVKIGSDGKKLLKLLLALRNTVHGESLLSLRIIENSISRHIGTVVVIPSDKEQEILTAANDLGGHENWGITHKAGRYFIEPDVLVDKLIPEVIELIDKLIEKIPLENLNHVSLTTEDCQPPTDPQEYFFLESSRKNIRWQLGF